MKEFVKQDGMLDDVEVFTAPVGGVTVDGTHYEEGTKFIKFTWNINEGESKKTDYILLSDIATTYKGSDSIEISEDNTLSVGTVGSSKVDVNSIPVGGTPLAEILLKNGIKTIDAGNLQVVLENLFSVEADFGELAFDNHFRGAVQFDASKQNVFKRSFRRTVKTGIG